MLVHEVDMLDWLCHASQALGLGAAGSSAEVLSEDVLLASLRARHGSMELAFGDLLGML